MHAAVIPMRRRLNSEPVAVPVDGVVVRNFMDDKDIDRWLALREAAFADLVPQPRAWNRGDFVSHFSGCPWWSSQHCWIAEDAQSLDPSAPPAGAIILAAGDPSQLPRAAIHWLMVRPNRRRLGLGRYLVGTLEARCWHLGYRTVWLETHRNWQAAVHLYEALGYEPLG